MDYLYKDLVRIFNMANNTMISKDLELLLDGVSERTICGALKSHLERIIKSSRYKMYYVDVEYNRNKNGKIKTCCKLYDGFPTPVTINCDLIVHSRGHIVDQDNLIAIEMKKSSRSVKAKNEDRLRLSALTKDSYDDVWSFDGKTLPEHVCRYKLGVYYEINLKKREIQLEYYYKGEMIDNDIISF